jgi:hypothetical protein
MPPLLLFKTALKRKVYHFKLLKRRAQNFFVIITDTVTVGQKLNFFPKKVAGLSEGL